MDELTIITAYESGEITDDEFVSLEAYISETSKSTKDKRDELIAKDHGINLKNKSKASYKALADAKHKDRSSEYERDSDGVRYKNHDPYDRPSIDRDYFAWDKNNDIVSAEKFVPKTAKTKKIADMIGVPVAIRNQALERQLKSGVNSMPDADESLFDTISKLKSRRHLGKDGGVVQDVTQDEIFTDKKKRLLDRSLGSRHDKNIPEGDRKEIDRRKEDEYDLGRRAARTDKRKGILYSSREVLDKGKPYDKRAMKLRESMRKSNMHPDDIELAREARHGWGDPSDISAAETRKYIERKLNLMEEVREEQKKAREAKDADERKRHEENIKNWLGDIKSIDEILKEAKSGKK